MRQRSCAVESGVLTCALPIYCQNFAAIDLHPSTVPDRVKSNVYEHLIRRFGSEVNEAAEDFITPRDEVHLAIEVLLDPDDHLFEENPGLIRTIYDPTCGTGGFLTDGMDHVDALRDRFKEIGRAHV